MHQAFIGTYNWCDTGHQARHETNGSVMQLIKVAGKPGPALVPSSGWRKDVVIGHRFTGGHLIVHSPDQSCSWCAVVPDAISPLTDAIKDDRTILMAER